MRGLALLLVLGSLIRSQGGEAVEAVSGTKEEEGRTSSPIEQAVAEKVATSTLPVLVVPTESHDVKDIAVAPNEQWLAAVSSSGDVVLWGLRDGVPLRAWQVAHGHSAAIDPTGRLLAVSSGLGAAQVWEVRSGRLVRTLESSGFRVVRGIAQRRSVAFLGSEKTLLVAETPKLTMQSPVPFSDNPAPITIFDVEGGRVLRSFRFGASRITAIALSPTEPWVAVASDDHTVRFWNLDTGARMFSFGLQGEDVVSLAVSADSRYLAMVSAVGNVLIREIGSWRLATALQGIFLDVGFDTRSARVAAIRREPNGAVALAVFQIPSGEELYRTACEDCTDLAWAPSGKIFVAAGSDILIVDPETDAKRLLTVDQSAAIDPVVSFIPSEDPNEVITVHGKGLSRRVWNIRSGRVTSRLDLPMRYHADRSGQLRIGVETGGWLVIQNQGTGESLRLEAGAEDCAPDVSPWVSTSLTGDWVAFGCSGAEAIRLFHVPGGARYKLPGCSIPLNFDVGGKRLAAECASNSIGVWDLSTQTRQFEIPLHIRTFGSAVAFSADGRWFALQETLNPFTFDEELTIWDVSTMKPKLVHRWNTGPGIVFGFSPDSKMLAATCSLTRVASCGTVALVELGSGEVRTIIGRGMPDHRVVNVHFPPDGKLLLSVSPEGSVEIWNAETGELLGSMYALREGLSWVAATPDGLFDGSRGAWRALRWRFEGDTFNTMPVELFFNEYFSPGLLRDLFEGIGRSAPTEIAGVDRRQPRVSLALAKPLGDSPISERHVDLRIAVEEIQSSRIEASGPGAYDLRLFRDGSLVDVWRGDVLQGHERNSITSRQKVHAGHNSFSAYAFSRAGIKSADAVLRVDGSETLERSATLYLICVGVNEYIESQYRLRFAVADALAFCQRIADLKATRERYGTIERVTILDQRASKESIMAALHGLSRRTGNPSGEAGRLRPAEPEDSVIVYFGGHGIGRGDRYFLLPQRFPFSRGLESGGILGAEGISDLDLESALEGVDARRIIVVIDACEAGHVLDTAEDRRGPMNSRGLAQLAYEKGMYVLAASQSSQVAIEAEQLGHGLLTHALIEEGLGMDAADWDPSDGRIWAHEWFEYAVLRVPEIHQEMRGEKVPQRGVIVLKNAAQQGRAKEWRLQTPRAFYPQDPEETPFLVELLMKELD